jgi:molecular chaperone GrpE
MAKHKNDEELKTKNCEHCSDYNQNSEFDETFHLNETSENTDTESYNLNDRLKKKGEINEETLYYLELSQRLKADFENYKKRNADIMSASYKNGIIYAVEKLLPVVDGISRAKLNITDEATLKGFDIINAQFLTSLESLGVTKIECVGKEFDPNFHNAVMTASDEKMADNIVLDELQQGFMLGEKVIRHSVVKINKLS